MSNAIVLGWTRAVPGKEKQSIELFQEFVGYITGLQKEGKIASFEPVFLDPHGGDMNGFFLIRGETPKLDALLSSESWIAFATRGMVTMQGFGVIRAAVGDEIPKRMAIFSKYA
jgi:hypothetical protein